MQRVGMVNKRKHGVDGMNTLRRSRRKDGRAISNGSRTSTSRTRKEKEKKTGKVMCKDGADGTSLRKAGEKQDSEGNKRNAARCREYVERSTYCNDATRSDNDGKQKNGGKEPQLQRLVTDVAFPA